MIRGEIWREIMVKIVISVLTLAVSGLVASWFKVFREGLSSYDVTLISVSAVLFTGLFLYEFWSSRSSRAMYSIVVVYLGAFASFFITTSWCAIEVRRQHIPVAIAFGTLLIGRLVLHLQDYSSATRERAERHAMGYAVTAVLISEAVPEDLRFILLFNRNLRGGKGLWVPPGGHFIPFREDPEIALAAKVSSEVALSCEVIPGHMYSLPTKIEERNTDACRWFAPPSFLLREALFGVCSHLHVSHLDFVYLCVTNGVGTGAPAKYDQSQRIGVPLRPCATSVEESERVIEQEIDAWYRARGEKPAGRREDITKDVAWRLHFAARTYLEERDRRRTGA